MVATQEQHDVQTPVRPAFIDCDLDEVLDAFAHGRSERRHLGAERDAVDPLLHEEVHAIRFAVRYVADDIRAVVEVAHRRQALVKVIFENCFLADEHKEQLCRICAEVGADYVKTSTGYGSSGALDEDLRLMRRCSPPHVKVKAAGGVRSFDRVLAVRALGVSRVGATATKAILDECRARLERG